MNIEFVKPSIFNMDKIIELAEKPIQKGEVICGSAGLKKYMEKEKELDWLMTVENSLEAEEPLVPFNVYMISLEGEFIGFISLRYKMSEMLLTRGGNIGLWLSEKSRGRGIGKRLLPLVKADMEINAPDMEKALYTSDEDNTASRGLALSWGGFSDFDAVGVDKNTYEKIVTKRYWIPLK